ncbi:ATP-dependent zinc metalloprotease FtsH [Methanosarcinales archaeon]|uniref:AAA family ATPase n=1 Tax=Candidatus Methanoperedens sp. BLZ2 TaxID=2035255 RepID=UPI001596946F|nr:AAA family ATPase [Candidatus Methanoperedens sp. BLZ2]MBZ0176875.1 AAA family ATPase [Candidatus Methanoperedens nitroreducens]MCX9077107.1 AAA family ATPase [Candidatus Methanoperedens sp.]MCX9086558.1 AAA family ATPase [Candidatus Methanoperedens sp.]CAG0986274.1 ATP-dependent zinc metalloprotease FtsH [Methanosarcinales archaeon]
MNVYETNIEYLLDELKRIDLLLHKNLDKRKSESNPGIDDFPGLFISEDEVNSILQTPVYQKTDESTDHWTEKIETITMEIVAKKNESIQQNKKLLLPALSKTFHLSPFEEDVLLICLAPELDLRYEKLYSYLQNDVTKKRPTVDLVIRLLCSSIRERIKAREFFSNSSTLLSNRLIYFSNEDGSQLLLSRFLRADDKIINFLLGTNEIDHRIKRHSFLVKPRRTFGELILADEIIRPVAGLVKKYSNKKPPVLYFQGPYGTGKKMTAEAISKELGVSLFVVDSKTLLKSESFETLGITIREALLQDSLLYLEGFDSLFSDENAAKYIIRELGRYPGWIILSGEADLEPGSILKDRGFISFGFKVPSYLHRKELWKSLMNGNISNDVDIGALASKFNFSGGLIKDAITTSQNISIAKNKASKLTTEDLFEGCRAQSNKKLISFARKIESTNTWEDIFLPDDTKKQLNEVCGYIKYKGIIYAEWGFDKKLSLGKGLNVLFSGPSGTGKTMVAGIIANEVKLDLYKIDLSNVVSKYIGETEKNLGRIFKEAETTNAIIFFDEADALFGKRSEVRDSHDRYANIEINYLLQKMEEYEGIVILASNFSNNIDEAFLRRLHFKIDFPSPDEELREKIWRNIFPRKTPVAENIDYSFLSMFKITGGNMKNIALSAAFLAAGDSGVIKMEHIIKGTQREFQKMGKLCTKEDFGQYYKILT